STAQPFSRLTLRGLLRGQQLEKLVEISGERLLIVTVRTLRDRDNLLRVHAGGGAIKSGVELEKLRLRLGSAFLEAAGLLLQALEFGLAAFLEFASLLGERLQFLESLTQRLRFAVLLAQRGLKALGIELDVCACVLLILRGRNGLLDRLVLLADFFHGEI